MPVPREHFSLNPVKALKSVAKTATKVVTTGAKTVTKVPKTALSMVTGGGSSSGSDSTDIGLEDVTSGIVDLATSGLSTVGGGLFSGVMLMAGGGFLLLILLLVLLLK